MAQADYVIVGSGLTGATIARALVDHGCDVLVVERRCHPGGNVADYCHPSGIWVQRHGPHYFRTSSTQIWDYVNRFAAFHPFEAAVKSRIDGRLENWPIAASYLQRSLGAHWKPDFTGIPHDFEEAALSMMPRAVYQKFVRPYTEKQWGAAAKSLSAGLCRRFDVRADDDPRLTPRARHQGLPLGGYSRMLERMLEGIPLELNCDYLTRRDRFKAHRLTVFTGPIDLYFGGKLGRLAYRGQDRHTEYLEATQWVQPCIQVNEPSPEVPHIRTIEWKHALPDELAHRIHGTVVTRETPFTPTDVDHFEYPFPDSKNDQLYRRYRMLADRERDVLFCGRLGEYRYYDMDQAIARAQMLAQRILQTYEAVMPAGTEETTNVGG